jgi:NAD(P)-binding Rossmann-like domain
MGDAVMRFLPGGLRRLTGLGSPTVIGHVIAPVAMGSSRPNLVASAAKIERQSLVGRQAVVVGAGMGGMAAAGALADYFEQVLVFERDALPSQAAHRAGTPQSRHLHALLAGGLRPLEELCRGFEQNLARAGRSRRGSTSMYARMSSSLRTSHLTIHLPMQAVWY